MEDAALRSTEDAALRSMVDSYGLSEDGRAQLLAVLSDTAGPPSVELEVELEPRRRRSGAAGSRQTTRVLVSRTMIAGSECVGLETIPDSPAERAARDERADAHYRRAAADRRAGRWDEARERLDDALEANARHEPSLRLACSIDADRGEWALVAEHKMWLIASCPDRAAVGEVIREIGDIWWTKLGDLHEAADFYASASTWSDDVRILQSIVRVRAEILGYPHLYWLVERNANASSDPTERARYRADAARMFDAMPTPTPTSDESPSARLQWQCVPHGGYTRDIALLLVDELDHVGHPHGPVRAWLARRLDSPETIPLRA